MKFVSSAAIAIVLAASSVAFSSSTLAQSGQKEATAEAKTEAKSAHALKFSKGALKALAELQKVVTAKDVANFPAALAAAEAAAKNVDDHYMIAQLRLSHALNNNDNPGKIAALEAILASGGSPAESMESLYIALGGLNYDVKHYDQAAAAYEKLVELNPNSQEGLLRLAELHGGQKRYGDAVTFLERAIDVKKAGGEAIPENWYKRGMQFAYDGKLVAQFSKLSRNFIAAYPTPANWRDSLLAYREMQELGEDVQLDLFRLMRHANALKGENDFYVLSSMLVRGNFPAEAKATLDEGSASNKIQVTKPIFSEVLKQVAPKIAEDKAALPGLETRAKADATGRLATKVADGYFGHANYTKAVELYRLALQKGSIDANLANNRLGIALALSGQKAEAEAAFKAVAGQRQELANFWLLWLSQRP
jgi:tetratricopeptide (TPR) repeat protein